MSLSVGNFDYHVDSHKAEVALITAVIVQINCKRHTRESTVLSALFISKMQIEQDFSKCIFILSTHVHFTKYYNYRIRPN